jgi:hemolysin D
VASFGTVIQPGQTVATVVPLHAPLTVDADVSSQDVGFIKVGQTVEIKVSAFPFEQYGMIPGIVTSISPTAEASNTVAAHPAGESHQSQAAAASPAPSQTQSGTASSSESAPPTLYYRVQVQPEQDWLLVDGTRHSMSAGMTVTVDIRTGWRRVLDFFLDPVIKNINNGISVRQWLRCIRGICFMIDKLTGSCNQCKRLYSTIDWVST